MWLEFLLAWAARERNPDNISTQGSGKIQQLQSESLLGLWETQDGYVQSPVGIDDCVWLIVVPEGWGCWDRWRATSPRSGMPKGAGTKCEAGTRARRMRRMKHMEG